MTQKSDWFVDIPLMSSLFEGEEEIMQDLSPMGTPPDEPDDVQPELQGVEVQEEVQEPVQEEVQQQPAAVAPPQEPVQETAPKEIGADTLFTNETQDERADSFFEEA
tara:strand:+ start:1449 stop:1769 length:321 start_codon:yes stop_codon:yes gene_type:complete